MSRLPSWPARLNPRSRRPSTSWTWPASKTTGTCESTRLKSLTRWSPRSRRREQPWPFASGGSMMRPTTFSYRGSCPLSGSSCFKPLRARVELNSSRRGCDTTPVLICLRLDRSIQTNLILNRPPCTQYTVSILPHSYRCYSTSS